MKTTIEIKKDENHVWNELKAEATKRNKRIMEVIESCFKLLYLRNLDNNKMSELAGRWKMRFRIRETKEGS